MAEHHSIGLVAGVILVALLLLTLIGPQGASWLLPQPPASYELAGSATPAK
jgi:hypothetical protein